MEKTAASTGRSETDARSVTSLAMRARFASVRVRLASPAIWVTLGATSLALWLYWPAFYDPLSTGFGDWQMIHHNWEAGWVSITRFEEWPLWDPFHCGGVTTFGNPESQHFSPWFALAFLMHPTVAVKVTMVGHCALGFGGAYWLGRRRFELEPAGAVLAAVAWGSCGFFSWQLGMGHGTFLPFFYLPWLLLAWRASFEDLRYSAAVAAVLTLTLAGGGTYPFPFFVLLLAFEALAVATPRLLRGGGEGPTLPKVVAAGVLSAVLTALLGAFRVLPILSTLSLFPRNVTSWDLLQWHEVIDVWTLRTFPWEREGHPFLWPEYSAYVGWAVFIAAAIGLALALRRRRFVAVVGLLVFASLLVGYHGAWSPWGLLRHNAPFFGSLRVPTRFGVVATFYLAVLAGYALDGAAAFVRTKLAPAGARPWRGALAWALPWAGAVAMLASPVWTNGLVQDRWLSPHVAGQAAADEFNLVPGYNYHWIYASLPRRNQGTGACYAGAMVWKISNGLWNGASAQARVPAAEGTLLASGKTTRSAWAFVDANEPTHVTFNQNFHPHWVASVGQAYEDDRHRLAVRIPAGRHQVEVRYEPPTLPWAVFLSLLGLLGTVAVASWPRRGRDDER